MFALMFAHSFIQCQVLVLHLFPHIFIQEMKSVPVGWEGKRVLVATLSHVIAVVEQGIVCEMLVVY